MLRHNDFIDMPIAGEEGGERAQNVSRVVLNGKDSTTFKKRGGAFGARPGWSRTEGTAPGTRERGAAAQSDPSQ